MKKFKSYLQTTLEKGVTDAIVVETSKIFTEPWVRMKCQYGCVMYGKGLCCFFRTLILEEMRRILDSYKCGIFLHCHIQKGYKHINDFNEIIVDLERIIFLDGYYKAWVVGSGSCTRCKECNIDGACLYPDKARFFMEFCGIDVYKTARENGLLIQVVKDYSQDRDIYGLVLVEQIQTRFAISCIL